ncbi:peptidase M38 family protein [Arthrobacter sp. W1]|nr:peptidase M38 family protein [Arthrobacter sp. W1]
MYSDIIFTGGSIRTMDPAQQVVSAMGVRGGKITALGSKALNTRGPATEVVDLGHQTLLPGFHDAHIHPLLGGLQMMNCNLDGVHSLSDYQQIIRNFSVSRPDLEWIQGSGWYGDVFNGGYPTRDLLDELVPDRPAYLLSHDAHGAWVNSLALERAGITDSTPDPEGGIILRDASGTATGMLMERATDLVASLLPLPDESDVEQALLAAQDYLHSLGIVAWQDAAVGQALGVPDVYEGYRRLDQSGRLTASVTGALWWHADQGLDQLPFLLQRKDDVGTRFASSAVKLMLDGVCENLTASLTRPYAGHTGNRGLRLIDPYELKGIAVALDANGFDMHLHAVGDQAVHDALVALQLPQRPGWQPRHQLAHVDVIQPQDLSLFARTGAIANIQALWARQDPVLVETKLPFLDQCHQDMHFAFESLHAAGVPLAMGSDWPVSSPDPLWAIHTAVNRTAPGNDPHAQDERSQTQPLLPHEAITLAQALQAQTAGAAFAGRQEAQRGRLQIGLQADFAVLDTDPFNVEAHDLGEIKVEQTWIDGRIVYGRDRAVV